MVPNFSTIWFWCFWRTEYLVKTLLPRSLAKLFSDSPLGGRLATLWTRVGHISKGQTEENIYVNSLTKSRSFSRFSLMKEQSFSQRGNQSVNGLFRINIISSVFVYVGSKDIWSKHALLCCQRQSLMSLQLLSPSATWFVFCGFPGWSGCIARENKECNSDITTNLFIIVVV